MPGLGGCPLCEGDGQLGPPGVEPLEVQHIQLVLVVHGPGGDGGEGQVLDLFKGSRVGNHQGSMPKGTCLLLPNT